MVKVDALINKVMQSTNKEPNYYCIINGDDERNPSRLRERNDEV